MASLLDLVLAQRNPRLASMMRSGPNSVLARRDQMAGLFSDAAPVERDLFNPGPPPSLPQLQAAAQAPQAQVDPAQVMQAQRELLAQLRQQAVGVRSRQLANVVANVTGGDVPPAAVSWIREAAEDDLEAAPGSPKQGFLAKVFLGEAGAGLKPEQRKNLWRTAMLISGLQLLGQRGHDGPSWGEALASGILFARLQATATAGQLLDEQRAQARLQERASVFANSDLTPIEQYEELQRIAAREGDAEQVKILNDVLKGLREAQANELDRTVQVVDGRPIAFDRTGAAFDPFTGEQLTAPNTDGKLVQIDTPNGRITVREMLDGSLADPFTGQILQAAPQPAPAPVEDRWTFDSARGVLINSRTGEVRQPENLPERATSPARPTEAQGRYRLGLATAEPAFAEMEELLDAFDNRVPETSLLDKVTPGRYAQPEAVQRWNTLAEQVVTSILRAESGAAVTESEMRSYRRQFIPSVGDKPETIRQKMDAIRVKLAEMRAIGFGEGADAGAPEDDDDDFGFSALIPEGGR